MPSLIFPVTLWPGTTCAPADIQFNLIWSSSVGAAYIFRDLGQWEASKLRKSSFVTSQRISLHQQNAMAEKPCNHGGSPLTSHVTTSFSLWLKINLGKDWSCSHTDDLQLCISDKSLKAVWKSWKHEMSGDKIVQMYVTSRRLIIWHFTLHSYFCIWGALKLTWTTKERETFATNLHMNQRKGTIASFE